MLEAAGIDGDGPGRSHHGTTPPKLSDEALIAALADHPGSTAADLSKLLRVGQSTAAKRLASLEATGAVRRTPGGRVEGVRAPDHWSALRTADPPTAVAPAEETTSDEAVAEPTAAETAAGSWNLNPGRYTGSAAADDDDEHFTVAGPERTLPPEIHAAAKVAPHN